MEDIRGLDDCDMEEFKFNISSLVKLVSETFLNTAGIYNGLFGLLICLIYCLDRFPVLLLLLLIEVGGVVVVLIDKGWVEKDLLKSTEEELDFNNDLAV